MTDTTNIIPLADYKPTDDNRLVYLLMRYTIEREQAGEFACDELLADGPVLDRYIDENGDECFALREDRREDVERLLRFHGYLPPHNDNRGVA